MKKIIFLLLTSFFIFIFFSFNVFAQLKNTTNSAKTSSNLSSEDKTIEKFKEKVALKVQELMKKNNKAFSGKITKINDNLLIINDFEKNKEYEVKIDENLTKFYKISGSLQKEIKFSDLEKNDYLIVWGVIKDKTIDANAIFVDQPFMIGVGKIMEIDKDNYTFKVIGFDKTIYNVSIETFTKQQILNIKTLEIEKTGFSKAIVGDRIHFVCDLKIENQKSDFCQARKTLIIPQEYFIK